MNKIAREFLIRCFAPGSTIAFLLRGDRPVQTQQRVVTLEKAIATRYLGWLAHENRDGANIYVAANPLRSGSRRRTKESIASVRHVYLDIDQEGDARLAALQASNAVPPPSAILSTSPGKYQILWRVEGFNFEQQEITLKQLAISFGGDPACTDCNRVLRIPGFANQKYSPAYIVTVEYACEQSWAPADFQPEGLVDTAVFPPNGCSARKSKHKATRSEDDWAFVCAQIADGADPSELTQALSIRRSDKPNPLYYAQRTVDVASARQWFLEGVPINDVITMLHERHRFDLPAALCSTRSREIATTAQRMVMHRNAS